MPKVRRQRTKFHYSKPQDGRDDSAPMDFGLVATEQSESNEIEQEVSQLEQEVSVLGKKVKRQNRRNLWLKKLGAIHSNQVEEKKAARRRRTVVVGDVKPLQDALDEVAQILSESCNSLGSEKQKMGKTRVVSRNKRQMVLAEESKRFKAISGHRQFKADPLKAVGDHLKTIAGT